jgi:hypothetical protein
LLAHAPSRSAGRATRSRTMKANDLEVERRFHLR